MAEQVSTILSRAGSVLWWFGTTALVLVAGVSLVSLFITRK